MPLDRHLLRRCVQCGLCLSFCPTYRLLGTEMDSPRGRLFQMRALAEGQIKITDRRFREHIYRCLDCRACETACPSGVRYGALVEAARGLLGPAGIVQRLGLGLVASPRASELVGLKLRLYQRGGLQALVRGSGLLRLLPGGMAHWEALLPPLQGGVRRPKLPEFTPAKDKVKYRVAFLAGCVMSQFFGETNRATVRVLAENGCAVLTPQSQVCCGALHLHAGDGRRAQALARRNIDVFERAGAEAIIVNAAGCGAAMKEYGTLLAHDPQYAARAQAFSRRVKDIAEFLAEIPLRPPEGEIRQTVTYQDACHLAHAQRIREPPRRLLGSIPGLKLVEMPEADWCCGSAGIYNLVHYDMSMKLLDQKMAHIAATGAEVIAAGNAGCIIQLAYGVRREGLRAEVVHPVELLDRSYRGRREKGDKEWKP